MGSWMRGEGEEVRRHQAERETYTGTGSAPHIAQVPPSWHNTHRPPACSGVLDTTSHYCLTVLLELHQSLHVHCVLCSHQSPATLLLWSSRFSNEENYPELENNQARIVNTDEETIHSTDLLQHYWGTTASHPALFMVLELSKPGDTRGCRRASTCRETARLLICGDQIQGRDVNKRAAEEPGRKENRMPRDPSVKSACVKPEAMPVLLTICWPGVPTKAAQVSQTPTPMSAQVHIAMQCDSQPGIITTNQQAKAQKWIAFLKFNCYYVVRLGQKLSCLHCNLGFNSNIRAHVSSLNKEASRCIYFSL
jgi:hypothetical protein